MIRIFNFHYFFSMLFCAVSICASAQSTFPMLVKDLNVNGSSNPSNFYVSNDKMFFVTKNDYDDEIIYEHDMFLWVTNGTADGTKRIKKITIGEIGSKSYWATLNERVYFIADDGIHGYELWTSDGTEEGTHLVKDIDPKPKSGQMASTYLINFKGKIFFSARDNENNKFQLWESDGTAAGTIQSCKFDDENVSVHDQMDTLAGYLYFKTYSETKKIGLLYRTNGTSEPEIFSVNNQGSIFSHKQALYFAKSNSDGSYGIWATNGSKAGTFLLTTIYDGNWAREKFCDGGSYVYFSANDGNGESVWRTDGTVKGTILIKRINNNKPKEYSNLKPTLFCVYTGKDFLFSSNEEKQGMKLYKSTGTPETTMLVSSNNGSFFYPVFFDGRVYFRGYNPYYANNYNRLELWVTDGTSKGTYMLVESDQMKRSGVFYQSSCVIFKGDLYLTYNDGLSGTELFCIKKKR